MAATAPEPPESPSGGLLASVDVESPSGLLASANDIIKQEMDNNNIG